MGKSRSGTRRTPESRPRGIIELSADGFGFVSTSDGDFFIPAAKTGGAFDGDLVELAPSKRGGSGASGKGGMQRRPSARVLRVLERAHAFVVGRYELADPFGVVVPQDLRIPYDIFTMRSDAPDIADGAIVRVRMLEYPTRNSAATGVVEEVLGMEGAPGTDIEALIARHRLETKFSPGAIEQAAVAQVDVAGAFASGYADEQDRFVFTIDPFDARDFDDALSVSPVRPNGGQAEANAFAGAQISSTSCDSCVTGAVSLGHYDALGNSANKDIGGKSPNALWRLGIHIADVSQFVEWGSAMDLEARKRTTSVYLVDRVLPMLPEAISNDICSLVPGQPRRVFTVDVVVDDAGAIYSVDFHLGVIQSKARLSYDQAQCYIDAHMNGLGWEEAMHQAQGQPTPEGALPFGRDAHQQLYHALAFLNRFAQQRASARHVAGGIDFETTEAKVQLDSEGRACDVVLRSKTAATSCVEEAMILANECVARRLRDTATPGLFRVHDAPSAESLAALLPVLQEFGYNKHVNFDEFVAGNPKAIQEVLKRAHLRPEAGLVSALLLRAQRRAAYSAECQPHFGLASQAYCHFTSPIRRYPDLVVHRMLKSLVGGKDESYQEQYGSLPLLAEHSSQMERVAEAASRESQELKLVEYMQRFVGQEFEGMVSGVASYGLFVQLENTAEGLVSVHSLGSESFSFDPAAHKLVGQDSGVCYRLGQRVRVRLLAAPPTARKLEFRLSIPLGL